MLLYIYVFTSPQKSMEVNLHCIVHNSIQYNTIQYNTIQYNTIQHNVYSCVYEANKEYYHY